MLSGIRQFGALLSPLPRSLEGVRGHDGRGVPQGLDGRAELRTASAEIHEYAERQGWQIAEVYQDVDSGAKSSRRALNQLMADVLARKFDCRLVWKLDRFGRSLVDCLNHIRTLEKNAVRFIAVTQGLDTDLQNPASRFLLHMLGAAADYAKPAIMQSLSDEGAEGLDFA